MKAGRSGQSMASSDGQTTKKPSSPSDPVAHDPPQPPSNVPDAVPGKDRTGLTTMTPEAAKPSETTKIQAPIFVSYREVKGPQIPRTGNFKKPTFIKFFYLVDSHGNETLAATGEDQGDAHYIYRNAESFTGYGTLDCHNRKELLAWLDHIKQESQDAAGFHLIEDPPDQVLAASPVGSPLRMPNHPPFVAYRQEKFAYEDGHRGQKWFLVDESGHEQLAATAEERETRDGHYTYKAEGPLAQIRPLMASNMSMVQDWLDQMIQHPSDAHLQSHALSGGRSDRGRGNATPLAANRKARPSLSDHSQPRKTLSKRSYAEMQHMEDHRRRMQPLEGTEAGDREIVTAKLREIAEEEKRRRTEASQNSLKWLQGSPNADQEKYLQFWIKALRSGLANFARLSGGPRGEQAMEVDLNGAVPAEESAPTRAAALLDILEALRELGANRFTLPLMAQTGIVRSLKGLETHEEPSIAALARRILQHFRMIVSNHLAVLTNRKFGADPVAGAEAVLAAMAAKLTEQGGAPLPGSLVRGIAAQVQHSQPAHQRQSAPAVVTRPAATQQTGTPLDSNTQLASQNALPQALLPVIAADPLPNNSLDPTYPAASIVDRAIQP